MSTSQYFQKFLDNIKVNNADTISMRYDEITGTLNKAFRDTESKKANSLQVGSYGRWTAIKGISDLDMLYIMPASSWSDYKTGGQSALLTDTKNAISARYPNTDVKVDRLVVRVLYKDFHIEVQPVFECEDGSFLYPDTYYGGSWKTTKPREEIAAMKEFVDNKNGNLRRLCKMARAWKNEHGVSMGGLLIDTLAHNFLKATDEYDNKGFSSYDTLSRDFFEFLAGQENKDHYKALGSGQNVKVKKRFQKVAKIAFDICEEAISASTTSKQNEKWRDLFGRGFPASEETVAASIVEKSMSQWDDTEQFIEDKFPVDIQYDMSLDCDVSQNGFREHSLLWYLTEKILLLPNKKLLFKVASCNVPDDFDIYWKVLNRGSVAKEKNQIRGQIVKDIGLKTLEERTSFRGSHFVECYAVQNGIVVARDRLSVPIQ